MQTDNAIRLAGMKNFKRPNLWHGNRGHRLYVANFYVANISGKCNKSWYTQTRRWVREIDDKNVRNVNTLD